MFVQPCQSPSRETQESAQSEERRYREKHDEIQVELLVPRTVGSVETQMRRAIVSHHVLDPPYHVSQAVVRLVLREVAQRRHSIFVSANTQRDANYEC